MPQTLQFKSHFLLSNHSLFFNPVVETYTFVQNPGFATKLPFFRCSFSQLHKTHIQKAIVCAKRTKRRSGYQRSTRLVLQLVSILASNLKILPQPFDLFIEEFNGGDGGGPGFWKGFGGGGFSWWKRRRKGNLGFLVSLVILGSLFLYSGRGFRSDIFVGLFGIILIKGFKKNVQNWIFGLCCFGALMSLRLRREEAMKLIHEFRVCAPKVMGEFLTKSKRRGRWRSLWLWEKRDYKTILFYYDVISFLIF